jgi:hypothetical protein
MGGNHGLLQAGCRHHIVAGKCPPINPNSAQINNAIQKPITFKKSHTQVIQVFALLVFNDFQVALLTNSPSART